MRKSQNILIQKGESGIEIDDIYTMRIVLIIFIVFFYVSTEAMAQYVVTENDDKEYCIPSVIGLPRPKGAVYTHEIATAHNIKSIGNNGYLRNSNGTIRQYRKRELKLKAPLLNKPGLKMAMGLKYRVEDIFFQDVDQVDYPFYTNIQDRNLKSLGASLYVVKPMIGNTFILVRGGINFNGDFSDPNASLMDYARFSLAPLFGIKKSQNESYAFGLGYTQNFGRLSFYPLLMYNNSFTENFGVELLLPKSAKLRLSTTNKKNYMFLNAEITGSAYKVDPEEWKSGFVRRTDFKYSVIYEREIYDFIWFGLEAGMRNNLDFVYSSNPNFNDSAVINNVVDQSFFTTISLFLVPPKKFMKK